MDQEFSKVIAEAQRAQMSRRRFVGVAGVAAAALMFGGTLAGCSGAGDTTGEGGGRGAGTAAAALPRRIARARAARQRAAEHQGRGRHAGHAHEAPTAHLGSLRLGNHLREFLIHGFRSLRC